VPPRRETAQEDPAAKAFSAGIVAVQYHPIFAPLLLRARVIRGEEGNLCPERGWALVAQNGCIYVHPRRRAAPEEWTWVLSHALLHLGFGHMQKRARPDLWNLVCDLFVNRFLADLKLGRRPEEIEAPGALPAGLSLTTENALYDRLFEEGIPKELVGGGTGGIGTPDMIWVPEERWRFPASTDWKKALGEGLRDAVSAAVDVAAGKRSTLAGGRGQTTPSERARSWFMSSYPLLGSLAAAFTLVEKADVCQRMDIHIAAVDAEAREIYVNPQFPLDDEEMRFVMAHELLHVGLRHQARCQGRDPYLWNVACDYVINGWLHEMEIGTAPAVGILFDPELKGVSAEEVYDRITTDLRKYRKLATLRGSGLGDMLPGRQPRWWETGEGRTLDHFYRERLSQGLLWHRDQCRGLLPSGLVEEIEALSQPAIPWDVELAQWFDHHFPPKERRRSYARPSRRQMSTPDIPRPRYMPVDDGSVRTFGVVLDTSGSMDRKLLAKALGAIASYSIAREVDMVRLVFCDAAAYDQGYVRPEEIAGQVKVRGRGGTVLQPGLDLLEEARDFPKEGPVLVITDGYCENHLRVRRDHAFLVPQGNSLPFKPRGPVFWVS
jgi:predicted metal-dependent peptidase